MSFLFDAMIYLLVGIISFVRAALTLLGFLLLFAIVMYVIIP